MNPPASIRLELWLGSATASPAPADVMRQLSAAQVTRAANAAGKFSLTFRLDRTAAPASDFPLLAGGLVDPWNRVIVIAWVGSQRSILIDGFITGHELTWEQQLGGARLMVTGEDVSIAMDRVQYSLEYPQLPDSAIAALVLVKYAVIGVVPEIIPNPLDLIPVALERTPQQNATDRGFLNQLACRNGARFTVKPGPEPMMNIARWGPPFNFGEVQPALSIDLGGATNVDKLHFALDAVSPVQMLGLVQDNITELDLPLVTAISSRLPPLARDPALQPLGLMQARELFTDPRYGYVQALNSAQVRTDTSSEGALKVTGELDTVRYGAVLDTPGLVELRGAGSRHDGRYRVEEVRHDLAPGSYRQAFTLAREGTGSTIGQVAA